MKEELFIDTFRNLNNIKQEIKLIVAFSKAKNINSMNEISKIYNIEDIKKANKGDFILIKNGEYEISIEIFEKYFTDFVQSIDIDGNKTIYPIKMIHVYKITESNNN